MTLPRPGGPSGPGLRLPPWWPLAAGGAALIGLMLLGAWLWGGPLPAPPPAAPPAAREAAVPAAPAAPAVPADQSQTAYYPPFEEPQTPGPQEAALQAVDEALFEGLSQGGVSPESLQVRLKAGPDGEMAEVTAQLGPGPGPGNLARDIAARLEEAGARVTVGADRGQALLDVVLNGRLTHRLVLRGAGTSQAAPAPTHEARQTPPPAPHQEAKPQPPAPESQAPPAPPPPGQRPRLALVIDDLGYRLGPAKKLLDLDLNLTFSILAHSPHAREIADLAHQRGRQVMVHLPMEPRSYPRLDPGPGALLVEMGQAELARRTREALGTVPYAAGANNHMGSRFTEEPAAMTPVLQVLAQKGLFFLDSATSANSQAYCLARDLGLPSAVRAIFLDHDHRPAAVKAQLRRLLALARRRQGLIAIAHPHRSTLEALAGFRGRLTREVELVPVSQMLPLSASTKACR